MRSSGIIASLALASLALAEVISPRVTLDPVGDTRVCRVDPGANGEIDLANHKLPDVKAYLIGRWKPDAAQLNLFTGHWDGVGEFLRFDLVFEGLVNPPGTLGDPHPWDPFKYGPNPVYGFVEFDMDRDLITTTGGGGADPQYWYLGNAARFGGMPPGVRFVDHVATDASAFDQDIATSPLVDRSGEDWHLALSGELIDHAGIRRSELSDYIFGPGETWWVPGRLWHRAHGYEQFSNASCTRGYGIYEPAVTLQFNHDLLTDRTTISLVAPLTNAASFETGIGDVVEILDGDCQNQNSVLEGLDDLVYGTHYPDPAWPRDPQYVVISAWEKFGIYPESNSAFQFLDPKNWDVTILVGGSFTVSEGNSALVYSDLVPNASPGDFNGTGAVDQDDLARLYYYVVDHDGKAGWDADGTVNGSVAIPEFGPNFSLFDVNYDGQVSWADRPLLPRTGCPGGCSPADFDRDRDADGEDVQHLLNCFTGDGLAPPAEGCYDADLDHDYDVDQSDFGLMQVCLSGPGIVANPSCP